MVAKLSFVFINLCFVKAALVNNKEYDAEIVSVTNNVIEKYTWFAVKGDPTTTTQGIVEIGDLAYLDSDGCDGTHSANYLIYSKVFEPHPCAKLNVFINSYEVQDIHTQSAVFHLGIIPINSSSTDESFPKINTDNFDLLQTRTASEVIAFGADHIEATSSFKLAIKFVDSCGTWTFCTGNVKDSFDIDLSHKTCRGTVNGLATFQETCQGKESDIDAVVYGNCTTNSVLIDPKVRPAAYCYDFNYGYIFSSDDEEICVCQPGFEPRNNNSLAECTPCVNGTFKSEPSNRPCALCPIGSYSLAPWMEKCLCDYGKFRLKKNSNGTCHAPHKPKEAVATDSDYTWINVSMDASMISKEHPFIVYVYYSTELKPGVNPQDSQLLSNRRPFVFLNNLAPYSDVSVLVCDPRGLDYSPTRQRGYLTEEEKLNFFKFVYGEKILMAANNTYILNEFNSHNGKMDWRYFACERSDVRTKESIAIKEVTIALQRLLSGSSPKLLVAWTTPDSLRQPGNQNEFRYLVDITRNGKLYWTSIYSQNETSLELLIPSVEATYRADVTLEVNGVPVSTVSSKNTFTHQELSNTNVTKMLVTVVVLVLLCLIILVPIVPVLVYRTRRDIHHSTLPVSPRGKIGSTSFMNNPGAHNSQATRVSVTAANACYYDQWNALSELTAVRFLEPETELIPFFEGQNKSWRDLLRALDVSAIPVNVLETRKLFDVHKMLAQGQIWLSKTRLKDNYCFQYDFKFCPHSDAQSIGYRSLLIEAATLAQLKHNHIVLMHGIVEYSTINKQSNIAILLEDCGTITLRDFCLYQSTLAYNTASRSEATGSNASAGSASSSYHRSVIEILHHLKGVASALEHFSLLQYVHKVLTSENVWINSSGICRVAGFEERVEFNKQPHETFQRYHRFWPPEVLRDGWFTLRTDVWSFGVMMWQSFCPNVPQPYNLMTDAQVEKFVVDGHCLELPYVNEVIPRQLSTIMETCFAYTPIHRPSPSHLKELIQSLLFSARSTEHAQCLQHSSIQFLLQQVELVKYQDNFKARQLEEINQVEWTEQPLESIGIQNHQDRRKLISSALKLLHGETMDSI